MHEFAARQVIEFLGGRFPPEDGVAMRMATEARDYVSMSTGLGRRVLQYLTELRRGLLHKVLCKLNRSFQMPKLLGMPQGQ